MMVQSRKSQQRQTYKGRGNDSFTPIIAGSIPLITELPPDFDEQLYLALNPDVDDAVTKGRILSGAWHWANFGAAEERQGQRPSINNDGFYHTPPDYQSAPPTAQEMASFDPEVYLALHADVRMAVGDRLDLAIEHWINHGRFEGRLFSREPLLHKRSTNATEVLKRPFGVNLFAPFSARSGLGAASRGHMRALRAANIPVHPVNIDLSPRLRVTLRDYDRMPPYRINVIHVNADLLGLLLSKFRLGWFDHAYTIAVWAWELNVLRPDWFTTFAQVDEVWTPSAYNTEAVQAISPVPVQTMNYVVIPPSTVVTSEAAYYDRAYFGLPNGFMFITIFDVSSSLQRKNPEAVIDAFISAFADRPDVYLIVKFHSTHHDVSAVQHLLRRVRKVSNVIIRAELLGDDELRGLQGCADCLISAHRSEGFGLNLAEFMLTGKPVIVTAYSGNMDFTNATNSYLVPYTLQPLTCASGPYLPGYLWADPDREVLVAQMRRVLENPDEAHAIGEAGAITIRTNLSAEIIGARIAARFEVLGLYQDLPPFAQHFGRSSAIAALPDEVVAPVVDPAHFARRPTLSVIVPVYNVAPEYLTACIESVRVQVYPHWELCLCDDASTNAATVEVLDRYRGTDPRIRIRRLVQNEGISGASNSAATMATGNWLVMLDNDDELTPDALSEIAAAIVQHPDIDALYADEDKLNSQGARCNTYHKPAWSPEHLESVMYTLHPLTIRSTLFHKLGGFRAAYTGAQDWDLMLRISRATQAIHHIPKILYHWRMIPGSAAAEVGAKPVALNAAAAALNDHLAAKYGEGESWAEAAPLLGHYRVRHAIRGNPPVTLLITTNNSRLETLGRKPFVMVVNLIQSILARTSYANYRIMVVDNSNTSVRQKAWFRSVGVELCSYRGPTEHFNYAKKANFAIRQVATEHLVIMNDDMEVINDEWLTALLEFSQNPEIGCCGGKLLHADGTIQHVGTVLGINGGSAHVYHGFSGDFVGYNGYTHVIRNYSAVTGACLATRRSVLNEVGGWDIRLATDYNDIDLCLRMHQQGYRIVYTPYSQLYHFEGKTLVRTMQNSAEVQLFMSRWRDTVSNDPYYNPNLSRTRHDYSSL